MFRLQFDRSIAALLGILTALGIFLTVTAEEGVFTTDENQYLSFALAVRQGEVTVPGTEGLPRALGLAYFLPADPTPQPAPPWMRIPVAYWISPLHAFLAAPLIGAGWKGLVAINVVGFCFAALFAFLLARRWATKPSTPWLAATAFMVGSFSIEYAQGVWPHMLSAGLCTAGAYFAARHRETEAGCDAALAGLLTGIGFGVRLQALVFVASVAAGLVLLSRRRIRAGLWYAAGLALPLLACSLINHASRGLWNPLFRKGYVSTSSGGSGLHPMAEWGLALWSRVIDYSSHPEVLGAGGSYLIKDPFSGATFVAGSFKKAWLQSAPWLIIPLVSLAAAWMRPIVAAPDLLAAIRSTGKGYIARILSNAAGLGRSFVGSGRDREIRGLALVIVSTLLALATRGLARGDGLSFNQRYLLDLMPSLAVALAWAVEPLRLRPFPIAGGAAIGVALAAIAYQLLPQDLGIVFALKAPILLAGLLVVAWKLVARTNAAWAGALLAACLSWSFAVHLIDDFVASRNLRHRNHQRMVALSQELRDGDALFAFWGEKDAFGPLQMDRDLLIVDSAPDEPETLARLTRALLERGRRVLVIPRMPADKLAAMSAGLDVSELGPFEVADGHPPLRLLQLSTPTLQPSLEAEATLPR